MLNGRLQLAQRRQASLFMRCHTVVYFRKAMHGTPPPRTSLLSFFLDELLHHS
ncbi:Uncharacterized protein APZ42_010628 [Daphnia magna]|uniref:Uncharacterized protein n=1 Tax=Daphnia magna TaxID=35525 RepID=A0A164DAT0_9CRUS|nr:Uncharacterized protein APZ42_010628 [Daphnia magna]